MQAVAGPGRTSRFAATYGRRAWIVVALAAALAGIAALLPGPYPSIVPLAASAALSVLGLVLAALALRAWVARRSLRRAVAALIEHDAAPGFTTDAEGTIRTRNLAARERFGREATGEPPEPTLVRTLRDHFANPAALVARLQARAEATGSAREDVVMRLGHVRLSVQTIDSESMLWRIEDLGERGAARRGADTLSLPMMTVSRSGAILFMNDALRRLVGGRVRALDRVFVDLPLRPNAVHMVHGAAGPVRSRVVQVEGAAGRREIFLIPADEAQGTADASPHMAAAAAHAAFAPQRAEPTPPAGDAVSDGLFESLPVALLRLDAEGAVLAANRLARDLLGPLAKPGARLSSLLEGLGRPVSDWLADAVHGRGLRRPETLRATRAPAETYVQVTLERMPANGSTALVAVLNDATELKTLEAQFVQSQKMQAIGQLAGGVAHDFNNLLTAISGHCDLLLLRHAPEDPDYADLVQINQNANRAASLVGQLLAFSRKQTLRLEQIDLRDALGELTHLLNRLVGERVTLTLQHDPELRPIRADKRQLEQVIMNLVVNARDAMPDGGEIRIETEVRHIAEEIRRDRALLPAGDYVLVRVADDGIGIAPDNLPKIFEPFFSTKRSGEGTGLGLSTAYGIVKQSGGYIFADSEPGRGTTFTLYFPAHEDEAEEPAAVASARAAPESAAGGVVLLVEDEAPVRAFASRALQLRGYTVIEAQNAEEALKALEDGALRVDVFVTDVSMPGMDGPSWVRLALRERPEAKVVFVSGYAEESFAEAQAEIPNSVFLPKPFSLDDLAATVHDQIH
ncbi:MAG: two-component system, cell cycle sensor histidine kinase and response regulator CckA [Rhodobacteraceae bacterium HLUCCA09]|nr:MAG: two-component system, cell cycle sensor histidine kinase and response regulator CckA [Rhodobacteraceae bacterium HLUCCA09]